MDIKDKPEALENTGFVSLQPHFLSCHTADGKKGLLLAVILDELLIQTPERVVHVGKPVLAITSEPQLWEKSTRYFEFQTIKLRRGLML